MTDRHEAETRVFKRIITELYPSGIVSIVADTFDFWYMISCGADLLKADILARNGKVVFRPDSGDPVNIICGEEHPVLLGQPAYKGAVECLWEIFGGTTNAAGFKELDPHVGLIYGDSITLERAHLIMKRLKQKGFASTNVVFGVGSFTYQHVTRDNFGFAVKSTAGIVSGQVREIFKDPVTDDGVKKSAKGFIKVVRENGKLVLKDQQDGWISVDDEMQTIFEDGVLKSKTTLKEIRARIKEV